MCRSIWRKELKKNLSCSILGLYKGNIMTRKEIIHRCLCLKRLIYRVNQIKLQGLVSRKTRGNFSGSKANFKIKTCWIVAQFLAHKPVNFASLIDSFIVLFSKWLKLWSWMQTQQYKTAFRARKVTGTFEKQARGRSCSDSRAVVVYPVDNGIGSDTLSFLPLDRADSSGECRAI